MVLLFLTSYMKHDVNYSMSICSSALFGFSYETVSSSFRSVWQPVQGLHLSLHPDLKGVTQKTGQ